MKNEILKIKNNIIKIDPKRWWGDDFDVRFFLISKLEEFENKIILDIGGGIGIISKYTNQSNFKINLDISIEDIKKCNKEFPEIHTICASRTHLPFKNNSIDVVICAHILAGAKAMDLEEKSHIKKNGVFEYPTVEKIMKETSECLKFDGKFFVTATNNEFYKTRKLNYNELKHSISNHFKKFEIIFFNTLPSFNKKYSKLNMTNVIPKLITKICKRENILLYLAKKDKGRNRKSISFFVEITMEKQHKF